MSWTYSGDPSESLKDEYRFHTGDTDELEPILQDAEIEYVLSEYSNHNQRMYVLFEKMATFFARKIKNKVGPIEEDPYERQRYFEQMADNFRKRSIAGIPTIKAVKPVFTKGMHDNG